MSGKTVFVLGAGASVPYGYPTGLDLREKIINNFTKQVKKKIGKRNTK